MNAIGSILTAAMLTTAGVGASCLPATSQSAQNSFPEQERAIKRMYAAFSFYTERANPEKAVDYIHSMLMYTKTLENTIGSKGADIAFTNATGIADRRKFFLIMQAADADGNMFKSEGPCTYYWQSARDGNACGERAAHPNQRIR